ncbi:MAG: DUF1592 domain-containing protein [Sandaracinaceae bacterium]
MLLAASALAGAAGCTGMFETPYRPGREMPDAPVVCDPEGETAAVAPLDRLARIEYERSLRALFGDAVVDGAASELATMPVDHSETEVPFSRTDHRLSPTHIEAYYGVADAIATQVSGDRALRQSIAGSCAADGVDDACLRSFIESFLRRAHRRDPSDEEQDRAFEVASALSGFERMHAVIFTTLMGPDFLYRFENQGQLVEDDTAIALTGFELASRLSYHFWSEPPDDELLRAAADGELEDDAGYAAQVDRLLDDPRADATIQGFFDEWLRLERADLTSGPRLDVLRDGMDVSQLADQAREEVHDLIRYELADGGSWHDVLTSPRSFARGEPLASIYGVSPWDGTSAPPMLDPGERSGLLTRAGMLVTTDGSTNPFRRGAFLRRNILCDHVDPPPGNLPASALAPPPVVEGQSSRDAFAAKIVDEPCASCHAQFSPLGYGLEAYDGLGRFRTDEWLVDVDGTDRGYAAVNMSVVPEVERGDESVAMGPVEMSQRIADSAKANLCLSTQYFRFAFRREDTGYDTCIIQGLAARVEEGLSLREALRALALEPSFRVRRLEE